MIEYLKKFTDLELMAWLIVKYEKEADDWTEREIVDYLRERLLGRETTKEEMERRNS